MKNIRKEEEKMIKIGVVVVVYNKEIVYSEMLHQFLKENCHIVIVDNSDTPQKNNDTSAKTLGYTYINAGGNKGISKAYNLGIEALKKDEACTHIMFLDDDTNVGKDYVSFVRKEIETYPDTSVFLPYIYSTKRKISPRTRFRLKIDGERINTKQNKPLIFAINTAMVIQKNVFQTYAYNEALFLDFVDIQFMRDMHRMKKKIRIMNYHKIEQSFSLHERGSEKGAIARYNIFQKDSKVYYAQLPLGRLLRRVKLIEYGAQISRNYENRIFLKHAMKDAPIEN